MEAIISRNYINSLSVKDENQLCNCSCNLEVFKELTKEYEKKLDELDKEFMPYRFENRFNIAYCKDCDSFYLIKTNYEASSKIDFEEIEFIYKKDYFEINDYMNSLEKRYKTDNAHTLYVNNYIIRILNYINNDKGSRRVVSFEDTVKEYDYIKTKKICYNCDNKFLIPNDRVECLIHKENYKVDYVCDRFCSIYEEDMEE